MTTNVLERTANLRTATCGDAAVLTGLMRKLSYPTTPSVMREQLETRENNPNYRTYLAEWEGRAVGMIALRLIPARGSEDSMVQIAGLVVSEECRGLGLGKQLLGRAEAWGAECGSGLLCVTSINREERLPAHEFYMHAGFKKYGCRFMKAL
ncbi:GNAT family N-acetyltransferase [Saccharibacillus sp. CPCC 101409]|uniref:GNAT family N-acetyltransferase n=1 Tax=Saccharibacillus sp. CPCC 101409 TaxID=3058041 RepID=UPI00267348E8|nr:GNAT family N-acetyltransferase [Saccharibacillus sp. CPCC 101409]MDO3413052.1 GNAT family N-acetyltransferase [Saccharibacillus sp. CPCC 101409]